MIETLLLEDGTRHLALEDDGALLLESSSPPLVRTLTITGSVTVSGTVTITERWTDGG